MAKSKLFNIDVKAPFHIVTLKDGDVAPPAVLTGVINAKQSAITFGGAPVLVTIMWRVLGAAVPSLAESKLLAVGLSIFVGIVIYAMSVQPSGSTWEKILAYLYGFINSFVIAATVLGIDTL
jgi:hypothetical protein